MLLSLAPALTEGAAAPVNVGLTGWPALVLLVLAGLSYFIRKVAPDQNFFHTKLGAAAMAFATAVIPAVTMAIQQNGLSWAEVQAAIGGALLSLLASANPSVEKTTGLTKAPEPPLTVAEGGSK